MLEHDPRLTGDIDARIAAAEAGLEKLRAARAKLIAEAAGVSLPYRVELGVIGYSKRATILKAPVVAGLVEAGMAQVRSEPRASMFSAGEELSASVLVMAAGDQTAIALARSLVREHGGDPDERDAEAEIWEFGPDLAANTDVWGELDRDTRLLDAPAALAALERARIAALD